MGEIILKKMGGERGNWMDGMWCAMNMGRAWDILAIEKLLPSIQVAKLAWREGAVSNPMEQKLGGKNPASMPGVESRLDLKVKVFSSHWKVNCEQPSPIQSLLFVHTQNTFANVP